MTSPNSCVTEGSYYMHLNSGAIYEVLGMGKLEITQDSVIILQSIDTDTILVVETDQFNAERYIYMP